MISYIVLLILFLTSIVSANHYYINNFSFCSYKKHNLTKIKRTIHDNRKSKYIKNQTKNKYDFRNNHLQTKKTCDFHMFHDQLKIRHTPKKTDIRQKNRHTPKT